MGGYIANTSAERQKMLGFIGANSMSGLFANMPDSVKLKGPLGIPAGRSELETLRFMTAMAEKNKVYRTIFRGAGAYRHYIPAAVKNIAAKERFMTAYTPYQAEISQGILQSIFEFQSVICELTGMDAANASVYDGASAAAEACAMCVERKKTKVLVSAAAHPDTIETIRTYCYGADREMILVPEKDGETDREALEKLLNSEAACLYLQQPNYYGIVEHVEPVETMVHGAGAKLIMGVNPFAMTVLKTAGEWGADIAVGEGQPLGIPLSFGGPYLGFMACKSDMMRKLPGRIAGETVDVDGKRAYVLTLQAREQHIRREKASSNVCSNQALCALTATAYVAVMGGKGLVEVAEQCMAKARYAADKISEIPGFGLAYHKEFFHEFVTACPVPTGAVMEALEQKGVLGGLPLTGAHEGKILWCFTELNTKDEIDALCETLKEVSER